MGLGGVGVGGEVGVVVAGVAGDFGTEPGGEVEDGVYGGGVVEGSVLRGDEVGGELDFGEDEALVGAVEDVDLDDEGAVGHEVAGFVDDAGLTEGEQLAGFVGGDFPFPFHTGEAVRRGGALDGEVAAVVAEAHADGAAGGAAEVALDDAGAGGGQLPVVVAPDEVLAFYFAMDAHGVRWFTGGVG